MTTRLNDTIGVPPARWLHRLCVLAVCLVWPLIWVGGLVTTYDAGMSVPDWPGTYGYNLFLYPYKTWLLGPFDLFIEHGHRLLGAVVGVVAIGIVVAAFLREPRGWVKGLAIGLLVAVIAQGVLGGMRVVLGDRTLAMIHGCFGPAFFALCAVACVVTSRWWWHRSHVDWSPRLLDSESNAERNTGESKNHSLTIGKFVVFLGLALIGLSYTQLVLGAQLRHASPTMRPGVFAMVIMMHVMVAAILWGTTALAWFRLRRCGDLTLSRPALALVGLVLIQILLGVGTWVVNYGWPTILASFPGASEFLLRSKGFADSIVVTSHVATGSLILAVSAILTARVARSRACGLNRGGEPNRSQAELVPSTIPSALSLPETVSS